MTRNQPARTRTRHDLSRLGPMHAMAITSGCHVLSRLARHGCHVLSRLGPVPRTPWPCRGKSSTPPSSPKAARARGEGPPSRNHARHPSRRPSAVPESVREPLNHARRQRLCALRQSQRKKRAAVSKPAPHPSSPERSAPPGRVLLWSQARPARRAQHGAGRHGSRPRLPTFRSPRDSTE
jgi:hypothetical protein